MILSARRRCKVTLHTGAGKTGTSAIQVALAALRPQLAQAGIHYPRGFGVTDLRAERGEISSGNAVALGWLLDPIERKDGFNLAAILAWLYTAIAEAAGRDLLFSSEIMQRPDPLEAAELCRLFAAVGYDVHIIYYVRHALDQSLTAYLQALKRGQIAQRGLGSLEAFIGTKARCPYLDALTPYLELLPPGRITVRLYDAERADLVSGFLRLLSDTQFTLAAPDHILNRSPTAAEQAVFNVLAAMDDGQRLCRVASDLLLRTPLEEVPEHSVSAVAYAGFAARNQPIVDAVNARFLPDGPRLLLASDRIIRGTASAAATAEVYATFARCLALLTADRAVRIGTLRKELNAARRANPRPPPPPAIPPVAKPPAAVLPDPRNPDTQPRARNPGPVLAAHRKPA